MAEANRYRTAIASGARTSIIVVESDALLLTSTSSLGGAAATGISVVNATTITATTPAGTAGAKNVVVTTPGGAGTGTGLFAYFSSVASIALTSNVNPSALGQMVLLSATISGAGATPTGTVDFLDGATPLCGGVALAGGQGTCAIDTLTTGTHSITVAYSGDTNYFPGPSLPLLQVAGSASTKVLAVTRAGTGSGTVMSSPIGINCGSDCSEPFASTTAVTLVATPAAGSVFIGWLGACTGNGACNVSVSGPKSVSATFAPGAVLPNVDIDGNGGYDALTDGLLMIRYLFGLTGTPLTASAVGPGATRTTPADIAQRLDNLKPILDVDGNGEADALTDGLLLIRHLFGLRGQPLIATAVGPGATRTTPEQIEAYIQSIIP